MTGAIARIRRALHYCGDEVWTNAWHCVWLGGTVTFGLAPSILTTSGLRTSTLSRPAIPFCRDLVRKSKEDKISQHTLLIIAGLHIQFMVAKMAEISHVGIGAVPFDPPRFQRTINLKVRIPSRGVVLRLGHIGRNDASCSSNGSPKIHLAKFSAGKYSNFCSLPLASLLLNNPRLRNDIKLCRGSLP